MSTEDRLESALKRVIRPLARLAIARGLTLSTFVRVLKRVLVDVADEEFRVSDKPATDSRIAVLTGVHRKDVRTLRSEDDAVPRKLKTPLVATVLGRWLADPMFCEADGSAMVLPRLQRDDGPSFASLVESVASDVRPRTILDAMVTRGTVEHDNVTDTVKLTSEAYVPEADDEAMMSFFASNLHDHIAAAVHNLQTDRADDRFLERAVFYSDLSEASVKAVQSAVSKTAREALIEINELAREKQKADDGALDVNKRFRFGVYFYTDDDGDAGPTETDVTKATRS